MVIPAAMFIEAATDSLKDPDYLTKYDVTLKAQRKEVEVAIPGKDPAFYEGYMLGIQTARLLLMGMPAAVINKVSI
jgi:hypothetical protein